MDIRVNGSPAAIAPKMADNSLSGLDARTARINAAAAPPVTPIAAPVSVQKTATGEPSLDQVKEAVQEINTSLRSLSQGLEFSIDTDSKRPVVKVIDQRTQEVIRQMPSEQALEFAKTLHQVVGKLLNEKA